MAVKNRLLILMAEKQVKEDRQINTVVVANETGISRQTISAWVNNKATTFRAETIQILCDYFDCEVADLLVRVPNGGPEQPA